MLAGGALAQNPLNGRLLYNSTLVSGELSCGAGTCHGPNPALNINGVKNGDTPGGIVFALNTVVQMRGLRGNLSAATLTDLAAYIDTPNLANGPLAIAGSTDLLFVATSVGQSSDPQVVTIYNVGNSPLTVTSVDSSLPDFVISSNGCTSPVPADDSCSFAVTFSPTASGGRGGAINVQTNAAVGSPISIGASGVGINSQSSATTSTGSLGFASLFVGQASASQSVTLQNAGTSALTLGNVSVDSVNFSLTGGTCSPGAVLAAGASCTVTAQFEPQNAGVLQGSLTIGHNGVGGSSVVSLTGIARALPANARLMVEFRIPSADYYFMTSRANEQALLDSIPSFQRTGASFAVFSAVSPTTKGITRYYFDKAAKSESRGTHFYTLLQNEVDLLNGLNPTNANVPRVPINEGIDSYATSPTVEGVNGSCPSGTLAVYRIFRGNVRFPDDPNHRFTTDRSVYDEFVALGWDGEGVKFCVPAP
jgi:hypothetical protein